MFLLCRVRNCRDDVEYHMYQQQWDTINRPQHMRRTWSQRQEEVLGAVAFAVSLDDEEQKRQHTRRLVVSFAACLSKPGRRRPTRYWSPVGSRPCMFEHVCTA